MKHEVSEQTPRRIKAAHSLSRTDDILILQFHAEGKTQQEIAQRLDCSQSSVSRVLELYGDTRILAKQKLNNAAQKLTDRVIANANVAESLDVLERIEVIAPKKGESKGASVHIAIGMPGQPAGPDPVIVVSPVPFALDAPQ